MRTMRNNDLYIINNYGVIAVDPYMLIDTLQCW